MGYHWAPTLRLQGSSRCFRIKTHSTTIHTNLGRGQSTQLPSDHAKLREDVSLKDLTLKTVMLVSLVSPQRGQTIHYLDDMISSQTSITFALSKPLKQSKPGVRPMVAQFTSYPADLRICVVTTLKMYLARTRCKRGDYEQLFISYFKPFKPVSRSTISRWIKVVMCSSGINVEVLRQHSTRAAATSKASASLVPLDQILSTAGWSSVSTFAKFYNKQIDVKNSFAESVLQSVD